jgi:hypothetical protein
VASQVILARWWATWKLDGAVRHFLCRLEEKGWWMKKRGGFRGHRAWRICRAVGMDLWLLTVEEWRFDGLGSWGHSIVTLNFYRRLTKH